MAHPATGQLIWVMNDNALDPGLRFDQEGVAGVEWPESKMPSSGPIMPLIILRIVGLHRMSISGVIKPNGTWRPFESS